MNPQLHSGSPHTHLGNDVGQLMRQVLLACVPGTAALWFFFGYGVLLNLLWLSALALGMEALVLKLRQRPPLLYLRDYSSLLTGVLLALSLPPTAPWWLGIIGIFFAIVVAKQLYGGLGFNPFNPAMVGYAVLLVSFPVQMTEWLLPQGAGHGLPDFSTSLHSFLGTDGQTGIDAYTGATALDRFRRHAGAQLVSEFWRATPVMGQWSGLGWEWINAGFLAGGLYLLYRKIISWHIPLGFLLALAVLAAIFYDSGSSQSHGSPLMHLFAGASMIGAFFIATDPVTAATTPRGKLIYGALVGSLVFVLRAWSNYPDGVAFAVLIGNLAAPLLDAMTLPRTWGHKT